MGAKKLTARLKAIKLIFGANQFIVFTAKKNQGEAIGWGEDDIEEIMTMAIRLKRTYNQLVDTLEQAAYEGDSLQALIAMRKAIEELDGRN